MSKAKAKATKAKATKVQATAGAEKIGDFIKREILSGKGVKDIVALVQETFPNCKTGVNSVYFYRSKLHKSGELAK